MYLLKHELNFRKILGIPNVKSKKIRVKQYKDLLKFIKKTIGYSKTAASGLASYCFNDPVQMVLAMAMEKGLEEIIPLAEKVIDQTTRKVIHGEHVPFTEKIIFIFEPHTDIIKKDRREKFYVHKVCLTGGPSNFVSDCLIVEGNPADSTLSCEMLNGNEQIYGYYTLKAALDDGFASKDNLKAVNKIHSVICDFVSSHSAVRCTL